MMNFPSPPLTVGQVFSYYTWDGEKWTVTGSPGSPGAPGTPAAPINSKYLVVTNDPTLTEDRALAAGAGIAIADGGPGGALTITATGVPAGGAPDTPAYVTLAPHAALANERILTAGDNIEFVDAGPGGALTINSTAEGGGPPPDMTGVARLDTEMQSLTGGAWVTPKSLGNLAGGTIIVQPGNRPIQYVMNNGAGVIQPGGNTGQCILLIINAGAPAIPTFAGWNKIDGAYDITANYTICSIVVAPWFSYISIIKVQ